MPGFSFISLMVSEENCFIFHFSKKLPFMWPWQPTKLSDLDKSHKKHEGLLNKHICEKNIQENENISNETAEIVN